MMDGIRCEQLHAFLNQFADGFELRSSCCPDQFKSQCFNRRQDNASVFHPPQGSVMILGIPAGDCINWQKDLKSLCDQIERSLLDADMRFDADQDQLGTNFTLEEVDDFRVATATEGDFLRTGSGELGSNVGYGATQPLGVLLSSQNWNLHCMGYIQHEEDVTFDDFVPNNHVKELFLDIDHQQPGVSRGNEERVCHRE